MGNYEVISGQHRFLAAKSLGREHINATITNANDTDALLSSAQENTFRKELTTHDRDRTAYRLYIMGASLNNICQSLSCTTPTVKNCICRYEYLTDAIKEIFYKPKVAGTKPVISMSTCNFLYKLKPEYQENILNSISTCNNASAISGFFRKLRVSDPDMFLLSPFRLIKPEPRNYMHNSLNLSIPQSNNQGLVFDQRSSQHTEGYREIKVGNISGMLSSQQCQLIFNLCNTNTEMLPLAHLFN